MDQSHRAGAAQCLPAFQRVPGASQSSNPSKRIQQSSKAWGGGRGGGQKQDLGSPNPQLLSLLPYYRLQAL